MDAETHRCDLLVAGGGLAGLTLAIQLKRRCPDLSIIVADRRPDPLPPEQHKVGESAVELGAYYFREIVGAGEHLRKEQIVKAGLGLYMTDGSNDDITSRAELAAGRPVPFETYNIHRASFETSLVELCKELGVEIWGDSDVREMTLDAEGHTVKLRRNGSERRVQSRWLVDASGRRALVRKRLGLTKRIDHDVSASWFRIEAKLDLEQWGGGAWRDRVSSGIRWRATNHLVGPGYWVWLIPLAPGATSVGIVAAGDAHPFEEFHNLERSLEFIRRHEPQLAREMAPYEDTISGFAALKHYAYGCERVYSPDRWFLTGEAAAFPDPLWSPGGDLIAIGNTLITEMIAKEHAGEDTKELIEYCDFLYLKIFHLLLKFYVNQYGLFGYPQALCLKLILNFATYSAIILPAFRYGFMQRPDHMLGIAPLLEEVEELTVKMETFFREFALRCKRMPRECFADWGQVPLIVKLQSETLKPRSDAEAHDLIVEQVQMLKEAMVALFLRAMEHLGEKVPGGAVNPHGIDVDPSRWEETGLFDSERLVRPRPQIISDLERFWFPGAPLEERAA